LEIWWPQRVLPEPPFVSDRIKVCSVPGMDYGTGLE
jgi:hypothetical protein